MKILSKAIPALTATAATPATSPIWAVYSPGNWTVTLNSENNFYAYVDEEIDLSGLSQMERTVFFKDMEIQMVYPPSMLDAIAGDNMTLTLMISDQPIPFLSVYGPGQSSATTAAENYLIQRTQVWLVDQDTAQWGSIMKLASQTATGLMTETASDTIYIRHWVNLGTKRLGPAPTSTLEKITVPPLLVVLEVDTKKEEESVYVGRLRRSYELAQEYDRD